MKPRGASQPARRAALVTALVTALAFLLGIAVTAAVTRTLQDSVHAEAQARFEGASRRLETEIVRRITQASYGLRGLAAVYASHGELTTEQFRDWVGARDLPSEFPGVRGFGLVTRVERSGLDAFVARQRARDPAFRLVDGPGDGPDVYLVTEIEPRATNYVAWGRSVSRDTARRVGIERAIATAGMALTDRVGILRDDKTRAGWLMFLPIYRKGQDPLLVKDRMRALVGLLYAPIIAADALAGVPSAFSDEVDFRLYDGPVKDGQLLFDSADEQNATMSDAVRVFTGRRHQEAHTFQIGGQDITLDIASTSALESSSGASLPVKVAIAGFVLSLSLALVVWQLARGRRRAEVIAAKMTRDLTRTAKELKSSEAFLEQAQQIANVGGWEVDLETLQLRLSSQLLRLFDLPEDAKPTIGEFIGFFTPQSQEEIEESNRRAIRDGTPWDLELSLVSAKGVSRWVRTMGHVDREGNRSMRLIGTLQDITDRKQAEQALKASEHLMRLVADNLPGRVGYWNNRQVLEFANRVFGETFGMTREQIVGMRLQDVLGPERYEEYRADIEAALRGETRSFEREEPFPDGSRRTMLVHYIPDVHDGTVHGFFVLALDVSELKEAREAARQASAAKGQFLANTSHELRTPMNAIIGMLTLLKESKLEPRQADFVQKAEGAARSLLGLLNDILDFSKVEAGKLVLDPRPFRVETLLRDLQTILSANLHGDGVALRFDVDPAVPPVLVGDDMRLRQVLINLGGNAVKFTEHGEVVVHVHLLHSKAGVARVEFSVRDTGIGIAPGQRSRIFDAFTQAEASTVRNYGGTGLGLAISQRLVSMMGGMLDLDSEPGRGSRFFFEVDLPVGDIADVAPIATQGPRGEVLAGVRILVVEDNRNNQQVARELLASRGAVVEIAEDGKKALDRVLGARDAFDLVLMDVHMPVMDGYTATRGIRAAGVTALPIVAMTANAMAGDREACLAAGMNDHVGKPFDIDELVATVRRHVGHPSPAAAAAPASAPAPAAETDFPAALKRLGNNIAFYRQIYAAVRNDADKMLGRLAELEGEGPNEESERLFHTLKGLAGTIGATGFAKAAAAGEAAMREGGGGAAGQLAATRAAYESAVEKLDGELTRLG